MKRFAVRSHRWGPLLVVVVTGPVDAEGAVLLASQLRRLQRESDILVDLWDVTELDAVGVSTLAGARRRSAATGWGFAVVAQPDGPCAEAIEAAGETELLTPFPSRRAARAALQAS